MSFKASKNDPVLFELEYPPAFLTTKTLEELYPIIKSIQKREDLVKAFREGFNQEFAKWQALPSEARKSSFAPRYASPFVKRFADRHQIRY